jgi:hypothetical protein
MTQAFNHDIHPKTLKQECMQYIYLLLVVILLLWLINKTNCSHAQLIFLGRGPFMLIKIKIMQIAGQTLVVSPGLWP